MKHSIPIGHTDLDLFDGAEIRGNVNIDIELMLKEI